MCDTPTLNGEELLVVERRVDAEMHVLRLVDGDGVLRVIITTHAHSLRHALVHVGGVRGGGEGDQPLRRRVQRRLRV